MNPLAAQPLNDLLAKLPQADSVARQLRLSLQHAKQVGLGGIRVHAQKQVGRGQIKEAQSMRLHHLRQTKDTAQLVGGRGNTHRQQRIASFGGRDQMAYRADAANTRHQRRHLREGTPFAEFFEPAKLRDMEAGILDSSVSVKVQRDLAMTLNASDRVDHNSLAHNVFHVARLQNESLRSVPADGLPAIPPEHIE